MQFFEIGTFYLIELRMLLVQYILVAIQATRKASVIAPFVEMSALDDVSS
jgi:hypothetical protein